MKQYCKPRNS